MLKRIKRFFIVFLREKAALPAAFVIAASLINYFVVADFFKSPTGLPINLAKASGGASKNPIDNSALKENSIIDADEKNEAAYSKFLKNNFIIPTTGLNWGKLHGDNNSAVDISDSCGKNIYAADEGLVMSAAANNGWNGGYGNYLTIKHPNGVVTKYAHTKKNFVKKGSYVLQGDPIAIIGNTGLTKGITGCHLHFEVEGAKNPFGKK